MIGTRPNSASRTPATPSRPAAARAPDPGHTGPGTAQAEPRIEMNDRDFGEFADRVRRLTGIVLPPHKRQMVISRLRKRLKSLCIPDFQAYVAYLDTPAGAAESGELTNVVTTNLTSFFRERHHFDDLRQVVAGLTRTRGARIRIWSAACSTGEEPYSIAMSALQGRRPDSAADIRILATDLNTEVLARARAGVYPAERTESCPDDCRRDYLEALPGGASSGGQVRVRRALREMITFNQLNLHESWPVKGPFDIIFCRNVLIYFSVEAKRDIVARFADLLRPGGTLYLGHSESMLGNHPLLHSKGHTIFRKAS